MKKPVYILIKIQMCILPSPLQGLTLKNTTFQTMVNNNMSYVLQL